MAVVAATALVGTLFTAAPGASALTLYHFVGTVSDADGRPLAGATVSDGGQTTQTDASGHYSLGESSTGSFTLDASRSDTGLATKQLNVTVPLDTTVNFTLLYLSSTAVDQPNLTTATDYTSLTDTLTTYAPNPGTAGQAGFSCAFVTDSLTGTTSAMALVSTVNGQSTWTYLDNFSPSSPEGQQHLTEQVQDCASNTALDTGSSAFYLIDNTPPTIDPTLIGPPDGGHTVFSSQPLYASITDVGSHVNSASIKFTLLDTTTNTSSAVPAISYNTPWAVTAPVNLTTGHNYQVSVSATDNAGNTTTVSQRHSLILSSATPNATTASIPQSSCSVSGSNGVTATATCPNVMVSLSQTSVSLGPVQADETNGYVQQTVPLSGVQVGSTVAGQRVNTSPYAGTNRTALTSMYFRVAAPSLTSSTVSVPPGSFNIGTLTATVPAAWANSGVTLSMPSTTTTASTPTCPNPISPPSGTAAFGCSPDLFQSGYNIQLVSGTSNPESTLEAEMAQYNLHLVADNTSKTFSSFTAFVPPQELPQVRTDPRNAAFVSAPVGTTAPPQALILGPSTACTNSPDCGVQSVFQNVDSANDGKSLEQQEAEAAGFQVTIVTTAQWQAMTAAQFASYRLLIIGDPHCDYDGSYPYGADANQSVWEGVVQSSNGNKVVIGTDPVYHNDYSTHRGDLLLENSFAFAGGRTNATGVSIDLSCFYGGSSPGTPAPLLNGLTSYAGPNQFTVGGAPCAGNIAIVAQSGPTSGMTDPMLSGWECSVHEFFNQFPPDYLPLAIATDPSVPQTYTAPDVGASGATVSGSPYIMMAGPGVTVRPTNGPTQGELQGGSAESENQTTCSAGFPVNCATGDFWHQFADLGVPGRGVPLNLTRTYSAAMASDAGPLGFGWTHSYNMSLTIDSSGNVSVQQQNGSVVIFSPNSSGGYSVPSRVLATLIKNSDGTYVFTPNSSHIAYKFNGGGQLVSETDRNGYTTTLSYSGNNLTTVTDPAGRSLTFAYTGSNISSVSDPAGRTVSFTYDAAGNLATATNPGGGKWSFTYDSAHHMLTMTDPNGGVITNTYDASGRVTQQVDPAGRTTTWSYSGDNASADGGTTTMTDPLGNQTTYFYQLLDLVTVTHAAGTTLAAATSYQYDATTLGIISITDPNGHVSAFSYDSNGNRLSSTDPLGRKTTTTYNSFNEPLTVTDPAGTVTTFTYDSHGNLTGISRPLAGTSQTRQTLFGYGDSSHPGDITSVTDPDGHTANFTYDAAGNVTSSTDALGNKTVSAYNTIGEMTSMISPKGNVSGGAPAAYTTTYQYDSLGDLTQMTDPLGHVTSATYDGDQNPITATDPANRTTSFAYDADNELIKTTRADGTILSYTYDKDGNETGQTNGLSNTTSYTYDALNRVSSRTDALGRTTSLGYDSVGNQVTLTDPAGQITTWSYDAANEVTGISYSDGKTPNVTNLTYSPDGQRTSMTDGSGTSSWTYDSLNRLTTYVNGAGSKLSYAYDLNGEVTSMTYPGSTGTVNRGYDAAGHLASVTDPAGHVTSFGYDPNGNVTGETFPSGTNLTDNFSFNGADQLTSISDNNSGTAFATFDYGLDQNGQMTSVASTGVPADNHSYSYDQLNRLTGVDTSSYTYDKADNLTKLISGTSQSFDSANELTSSTNGAFNYDSRGNRLSGPVALGGTGSYTYDQADRLTTATLNGNASPRGLIAGGKFDSLAVTNSGTVWAWGYNAYGQLGNGTTNESTVPVQVPGLTQATAVAAAEYSSAALLSNGTVETWGQNSYGELGNGNTTDASTPVPVSGLGGATAIAAGDYHMLALLSNGTVEAWGRNDAGQLGNGTVANSSTPVAVGGLTGVTQIAAGGTPDNTGHSVALKSDGTVWTWGYGNQGQLGLGNTNSVSVPTQVPGLTGVTQVVASGANTYALKSDGTVWAWGDNSYDQIGNKSAALAQTTPLQVNISSAKYIGAGQTAAFAIKTDGTTWGWGDNDTGQLGDGGHCGKVCQNPVQVQNFTGAIAVAGGYNHTLAVKSDGTVWAWGHNSDGELGDGNTKKSASPAHVSGLTNVKASTTIGYTYNGDGLRMSKTINGMTTQFTWDTSGGVPLVLSDGTNSYVYGTAGLPLEEITPSGTYYYHQDRLGSTRTVTDASGNVVATYTYDPYGNVTGTTGNLNNPLQFAGQYTDAESGLIYLRARYYDPSTAQFLTVDPLVGTTQSPYGYTGDNPLNGTDPLGLWTHGYCFQLSGAATTGAADPSGSVAGCIMDDGEGHQGVALMTSGTLGLPDASASLYKQLVGLVKDFIANGLVSASVSAEVFNTNAPSIDDLNGSFNSYGLTAGVGVGKIGVQATGAAICQNGSNTTGALYGVGVGVGIGLPASIGGTSGFDLSVDGHLPWGGGTVVGWLIPILDGVWGSQGLPTTVGE